MAEEGLDAPKQRRGQEQAADATDYDGKNPLNWLPELDPAWTASDPPLTPHTSGLLFEAGLQMKLDAVVTKHSYHINPLWLRASEGNNPPVARHPDDIRPASPVPEDRKEEELAENKREFTRLGSLSHKQPYDLYHRPFRPLNVVPDPYWEHRKTEDELARRKGPRKPTVYPVYESAIEGEDDDLDDLAEVELSQLRAQQEELEEQLAEIQKEEAKMLENNNPMNPGGTLDVGLEHNMLSDAGSSLRRKGIWA
jgi:hypothetical protein